MERSPASAFGRLEAGNSCENSKSDLLVHGHLTFSHMIRQQQQIRAEEIWDRYFDGDDFVYQGLDLDLIQGRLIESEIEMPSTHRLYAPREQLDLDLTVGERAEVDIESIWLKEDRRTKPPTSAVCQD
ncbi:MAG: hypothetical protein Q9168_001148 [Polycauliona sp. 1 TL-2023]